MKNKMLVLAATAAGLVSLSGTAGAAPFQPLGQRLAVLEQRINQGLHNGAIDRAEADSLRVGVARIRLIEAQYRRGGIDNGEQQDLDRRFDNLARHVSVERSGGNYRAGGGFRDTRSSGGDANGSYGNRSYGNRSNGNGSYGNRSYGNGSHYPSRRTYPSTGSRSDRGNYADRGYR